MKSTAPLQPSSPPQPPSPPPIPDPRAAALDTASPPIEEPIPAGKKPRAHIQLPTRRQIGCSLLAFIVTASIRLSPIAFMAQWPSVMNHMTNLHVTAVFSIGFSLLDLIVTIVVATSLHDQVNLFGKEKGSVTALFIGYLGGLFFYLMCLGAWMQALLGD